MISADLHLHTCFSHGKNTPMEMHMAAERRGLSLIGFSEHSPRPRGFDYTREYRDTLAAHLDDYVAQVQAVKKNAASRQSGCQVLFGMEMDWLEGAGDFCEKSARAYDFDYLIGSVHFLGRWGFDDQAADWASLSQEECERLYASYFQRCAEMAASGLYQIAAHPDLIKIFSRDQFHIWLTGANGRQLVWQYLTVLRRQGMSMEISSAGLRKACAEIYPAPAVMRMAAALGLSVSLASDAHETGDIASGFDILEKYARSFGFRSQAVFERGKMLLIPF